MDIKDKRKQDYLDNHELKKKKALQYYYDNQEERILYNRKYWALHGHKYLLKRF